jgi:biotin transporter BioY
VSGSFLVGYIIFWVVVGTVVTPFLFQHRGRNPWLGLVIGAIGGLIGQLACLGPLWMYVWFALDPPREDRWL